MFAEPKAPTVTFRLVTPHPELFVTVPLTTVTASAAGIVKSVVKSMVSVDGVGHEVGVATTVGEATGEAGVAVATTGTGAVGVGVGTWAGAAVSTSVSDGSNAGSGGGDG
jgi:hypothetical protein